MVSLEMGNDYIGWKTKISNVNIMWIYLAFTPMVNGIWYPLVKY